MADEERPLADRGNRDVPVIANFAASEGLTPDLALISPAKRARETWDLFKTALPAPPAQQFDPRLYAATADRLLHLVRETPADTRSLLLVGHNPGFEDLARALTGSGATDALIRFGGSMPTASLAVIDLPGEWADVQPRTGRLEIFVTPKSLGGQAD
ncbi:MAG: histidine phosphatase family protein [Xanthobacteraceae bacterium]